MPEHDRAGEYQQRAELMQSSQAHRYFHQQGRDTEADLQQHHGEQHMARTIRHPAGITPPDKDGEQRHRIGQHAMLELHRQRILEDIEPGRLHDAQVIGDELAIHQRPGIVRKAGI